MRSSSNSDLLSAAFLFAIVGGLLAFVVSDGQALATVFIAAVGALTGVLFAFDRSAAASSEETGQKTLTPLPLRTGRHRGRLE
jgi:hypothetical protein